MGRERQSQETARGNGFHRVRAIIIACVVVIGLLAGVAVRLSTWWHAYRVPSMTGQTIARVSADSSVTDDVSQWYSQWKGRRQEIGVAPQYQLSSVRIRTVQRLPNIASRYDRSDGRNIYVRLDATVRPRFASIQRITDVHGCQTYAVESGINESCVFTLEPRQDGYRIAQVMEPVMYQRLAYPEQFEKTEPDPTAPVLDGRNGYRLSKERLEVTYDGGTTWHEVPDGVARIVGGINANTTLWLEPSRYVITPQFTAFVGYDEGTHTAQLLYSWDAGSTWLTSALGHGVQAPSYISVVGDRIGVAYGYGDTLGSVGYAMVAGTLPELRADAEAVWRQIPMYMQYPSDLTMAGWVNDTTVIVGQAGSLHVSSDSGATWRELGIPKEPGLEGKLGYYPFDTPTHVWVEDGTAYLAMGQGEDADYAPNGTVVEAVFSYDPATDACTFIRQQPAPTPMPAG
nr:oxidoreductase [Bifidobacterium animalis]